MRLNTKTRVNQLCNDWMEIMPREEEEEEEEEPVGVDEEDVEVNEVVPPPRADPPPMWMEAGFGQMFLL